VLNDPRVDSPSDDAEALRALLQSKMVECDVMQAERDALARGEAEAEKRDPEVRKQRTAKRHASRGALPKHLPRIEVTLTPEDTTCPCCRAAMTMIGEDTSERLDVIPAQHKR
jgi:hypothetical protein